MASFHPAGRLHQLTRSLRLQKGVCAMAERESSYPTFCLLVSKWWHSGVIVIAKSVSLLADYISEKEEMKRELFHRTPGKLFKRRVTRGSAIAIFYLDKDGKATSSRTIHPYPGRTASRNRIAKSPGRMDSTCKLKRRILSQDVGAGSPLKHAHHGVETRMMPDGETGVRRSALMVYASVARVLTTCCTPNWDKRGADPTNREYNIHIAPESVGEMSNVTPSSPTDKTARCSLHT